MGHRGIVETTQELLARRGVSGLFSGLSAVIVGAGMPPSFLHGFFYRYFPFFALLTLPYGLFFHFSFGIVDPPKISIFKKPIPPPNRLKLVSLIQPIVFNDHLCLNMFSFEKLFTLLSSLFTSPNNATHSTCSCHLLRCMGGL